VSTPPPLPPKKGSGLKFRFPLCSPLTTVPSFSLIFFRPQEVFPLLPLALRFPPNPAGHPFACFLPLPHYFPFPVNKVKQICFRGPISLVEPPSAISRGCFFSLELCSATRNSSFPSKNPFHLLFAPSASFAICCQPPLDLLIPSSRRVSPASFSVSPPTLPTPLFSHFSLSSSPPFPPD